MMTVECVTLPCDGAISVRVGGGQQEGQWEAALLPPMPVVTNTATALGADRAIEKYKKDRERWLHELEKVMGKVAEMAAEETRNDLAGRMATLRSHERECGIAT